MLHVAVVDPLPLFRQGAAAALAAAGHQVDDPRDVLSWAVSSQSAVVLLTLMDDPGWSLLADLRNMPAVVVVAVLQDLHPAALRAVRLGARSVLPRACDPVVLRRTVEATADGQAVMPAEILTALASMSQDQAGMLSERQVSWLRQLADGSTVAELADASGYSGAGNVSHSPGIYREMGVSNRLQAVRRAQELGWLPASVRGS